MTTGSQEDNRTGKLDRWLVWIPIDVNVLHADALVLPLLYSAVIVQIAH